MSTDLYLMRRQWEIRGKETNKIVWEKQAQRDLYNKKERKKERKKKYRKQHFKRELNMLCAFHSNARKYFNTKKWTELNISVLQICGSEIFICSSISVHSINLTIWQNTAEGFWRLKTWHPKTESVCKIWNINLRNTLKCTKI